MDSQSDNLKLQNEIGELRKQLSEYERKITLLSEFTFDNTTNTFIKKEEPVEKREHYCPFCLIQFNAVKMTVHNYRTHCPECERWILDSNGINKGESL